MLVLGENLGKGPWSHHLTWAGSWADGRYSGGNGEAFLGYASPRWIASLTRFYVSPGFRDTLGFIPFTDFRGAIADLDYYREWHHGPLQHLELDVNAQDSDHYSGGPFRREQVASAELLTRRDLLLSLNWDGGRFDAFRDHVFQINLQAGASNLFHNFQLGYSWGRRADAPYSFLTPGFTWRFGRKLTLGLASSLLQHKGSAYQHIVTFNYDLSPQQGVEGRLVAQNGATNAYLSFRHSGYGGVETFLILGDPNATRFQRLLLLKVVWAL